MVALRSGGFVMKLARHLLLLTLVTTAFSGQAAQQPPLTATTLASGVPRAPEQEAVTFELADLSFKIDPARKWLDGDARLTFLAMKPVGRLVVDLDRNYKIELVEVDGVAMSAGAWRNPEGRMSVDLPSPLAAGGRVVLRCLERAQLGVVILRSRIWGMIHATGRVVHALCDRAVQSGVQRIT